MSVAEYNLAYSPQLSLPADRTEGEASQSDGIQPSVFDITEKKRPSGDRPITIPTSSVAQARILDNDYSKYALLVRRKVDKDDKQEGTQLEIQSSVIQDALRIVMPECAYLNLAAHPIIIQAPYYELFQYRHEIRAYVEHFDRTENEKTYLSLLMKFMSANLAKIEKLHSQYHPRWTSTYEILWTYFRAETFVVYQHEHYQELYRVRSCQYKQNPITKENYFELLVWSWGYNGKGFGPTTTSLMLPEFQGARNLREIECFPLECMPEDEKASTIIRLINRGKRWRHLVHRSYQQYAGPGWVAQDPGQERRGRVTEKEELVPIHITGRVMVDYASHTQRNYLLAAKLYTQGEPLSLTKDNQQESNPETNFCLPGCGELIRDGILLNNMVSYASTRLYEITDFQAILAPARIRGFAFTEKRWSFFLVEHMKEVVWMESKFQELELEPTFKETIQALVHEHREKQPQANQLSKKGRGLVVLLCGAPGTGKTLTAEAISEMSHRPLYYVGVDELLSSYFDDAETTMRRVFDLATTWGAIILLDEADVFMIKRGANQSRRDGLVAAFLRVLEYHEGIVFLTSNRLEDFDEAFESRLHLRLRYPNLDIGKRESVWRTALANVPEAQSWTAEDIRRLANKLDINGRQIANLVPTALAVSRYKRVPLTVEALMLLHKMNFDSDDDDKKLVE